MFFLGAEIPTCVILHNTLSVPLSRDLRSNLVRYPFLHDTPKTSEQNVIPRSLQSPIRCDRAFLVGQKGV